ncbi:DMT family transporter [Xanthobacter sp. TB0136]
MRGVVKSRSLASRLLPASAGVRGVIAMLVAMWLFVTNDTFVKLAVQELPIGETLFIRTIIASALLLLVVARAGDLPALVLAVRPTVLLRSGLDTVTTLTYVGALAVMPIAASSTIYLAAPLITMALAVPLLGEKVGWRSWCAVLVGFAGAIIVTKPDPDTFTAIALLPMLAAFFGAVRDISTRNISMEIPGGVVAFSAAAVLVLGGLGMGMWEVWRMPTTREFIFVVGAAFSFALGTLLIVYAFRNAPISSISPLRYVIVFGALTYGTFVFGDTLDPWTSIGMVLVVGSGLYVIHRERVRSRAERQTMESGCAGAGLASAAVANPPRD